MNSQLLPSTGHHSDMQILTQNIESLSGWLQQNREDWIQIQEGLAKLEELQVGPLGALHTIAELGTNGHQEHFSSEGHTFEHVNGTADVQEEAGNSLSVDGSAPTKGQLESALLAAQTRITSLEETYREQQRIQTLYTDALTFTTDRIRNYVFAQQTQTSALQTHYTSLLQHARWETLEAQLTHQAWQASLARLSSDLREAMKARGEQVKPWRRRVAALKEENRVLRRMVGWDPPSDSEDEEMEDGGGIDGRPGMAG